MSRLPCRMLFIATLCAALFAAALLAPPTHALTSAQIEEASQAFEHEPTVLATHQAALAHLDIGSPNLDRWTRRARLSALLPQVQGQVAWLDQHDLQNRFRENI